MPNAMLNKTGLPMGKVVRSYTNFMQSHSIHVFKCLHMKNYLLAAICIAATLHASAQRGRIHNAMEDKYGGPGKQQLQGWMNNMTNAKTEAVYSFPVMMTMHVTNYRNGQPHSETDVKYYINAPAQYFGSLGAEDKSRKKKGDEMLMVYDYKNNSMLMLNQTDKTGMAININAFMSGEQI